MIVRLRGAGVGPPVPGVEDEHVHSPPGVAALD